VRNASDPIGFLRQADELRVPLYLRALPLQRLAQQPLVVVLTQDQDEGIRTQFPSNVPQRHARSPSSLRPHVGTGSALAEFERLLDDAEL
jgi:hypothetical protein